MGPYPSLRQRANNLALPHPVLILTLNSDWVRRKYFDCKNYIYIIEIVHASSLGRYVFGSEISYNKAPPRLPGLGC